MEQIDLTAPSMVEVLVREDGEVLWVNVDGVCVLRICQITPKTFEVYPEDADHGIRYTFTGKEQKN